MDDRQLIADLLSALEYHTEQTRPIEFSKVAIQAAREYLQKPAPVQGWKLVPVEPTQKMLDAPPNAYPADALVTWKAMLAAAPQPAQQEPVDSQWDSEKYDEHQRAWCVYYERWTDFPPLMDDYEAGNESFVLAANKSVRWYESHTKDMYLRVSGNPIPGDDQ